MKEGSYSISDIKILKYKKVGPNDGYYTLAEVCASLQKGRENKDLVTFHGNVFRAESFLFPDKIDETIVRWTRSLPKRLLKKDSSLEEGGESEMEPQQEESSLISDSHSVSEHGKEK